MTTACHCLLRGLHPLLIIKLTQLRLLHHCILKNVRKRHKILSNFTDTLSEVQSQKSSSLFYGELQFFHYLLVFHMPANKLFAVCVSMSRTKIKLQGLWLTMLAINALWTWLQLKPTMENKSTGNRWYAKLGEVETGERWVLLYIWDTWWILLFMLCSLQIILDVIITPLKYVNFGR